MDSHYLIGVFEGEETLLAAFRKMKEQEIEIEDVFTPYPIHEILAKQGRKSRITIVGWFYGFFASIGVLAFLFYTAVINWPLNYGGKPSNSFPSFIVITIILTIFSVTILSLFTFSVRAKLWPNVDKPIYHEEATDGKFVILFEAGKIDPGKVKKILKDHGAIDIIEK